MDTLILNMCTVGKLLFFVPVTSSFFSLHRPRQGSHGNLHNRSKTKIKGPDIFVKRRDELEFGRFDRRGDQ